MRKIIHIDGIEIDVDSLYSIKHSCDPGICKKSQSCCANYEVVIDPDETDRIVGYMPAASAYAPRLGGNRSLKNVFEEEEDGALVVDTDKDGLCVFAYRDRKRRILCSLHSVALDMKLPYYKTKPRSCVLWPLAVSEDTPVQLSIADDAFDFPCNARRRKGAKTLDPNIAQTIKNQFGTKILAAIENAVKKTAT